MEAWLENYIGHGCDYSYFSDFEHQALSTALELLCVFDVFDWTGEAII